MIPRLNAYRALSAILWWIDWISSSLKLKRNPCEGFKSKTCFLNVGISFFGWHSRQVRAYSEVTLKRITMRMDFWSTDWDLSRKWQGSLRYDLHRIDVRRFFFSIFFIIRFVHSSIGLNCSQISSTKRQPPLNWSYGFVRAWAKSFTKLLSD